MDGTCEMWADEIRRVVVELEYYDEQTWKRLVPELVQKGEREELDRFMKTGVYEYMTRRWAEEDPEGKKVKVKWVRPSEGAEYRPEVRCRLVAHGLGYGERFDELLFVAAEKDLAIMLLDVKCAFLSGTMKRNIYIELPSQAQMMEIGSKFSELHPAY